MNGVDKAIYCYWADGSIIAIEDTGEGLPITFDAERVLQTIDEAIGPLLGKHVIYTNQRGIWSGLLYASDKLWFYNLGAHSYEEAKKQLYSLSQVKQDQYRFQDDLPKKSDLLGWLSEV